MAEHVQPGWTQRNSRHLGLILKVIDSYLASTETDFTVQNACFLFMNQLIGIPVVEGYRSLSHGDSMK
jgi:hypothetical protein